MPFGNDNSLTSSDLSESTSHTTPSHRPDSNPASESAGNEMYSHSTPSDEASQTNLHSTPTLGDTSDTLAESNEVNVDDATLMSDYNDQEVLIVACTRYV